MKSKNSKIKRLKRNRSKLKKVNIGRFRITVSKSLKNISAQIIDDNNNKTIVSASSKEKDMKNVHDKLYQIDCILLIDLNGEIQE